MVAATAMWSIAGVVTRMLESVQSFELDFLAEFFYRYLLGFIPAGSARSWCFTTLSACTQAVMAQRCMLGSHVHRVYGGVDARVCGRSSGHDVRWPLAHGLGRQNFLQTNHPTPHVVSHCDCGCWHVLDVRRASISVDLPLTLSLWRDCHGELLIGFLVPTAAAVNWCVVQQARKNGGSLDLLPAVLVGALISGVLTFVLAWPLHSSPHDIAWLALLGLVQLAMPCTLLVFCARILSAPEISLLSLLEVLFGIFLAWVGAGEEPSARVISGGALVIVALVVNAYGMKRKSLEETKP
jgi:hypothetical protein